MRIRIKQFIFVWMVFEPLCLLCREVADVPDQRWTATMMRQRIQNAGLSRNLRTGLQLNYHKALGRLEEYPSYWGWLTGLEIAPDFDRPSRDVDMRNHFSYFSVGAFLDYRWGLRYTGSVEPLLIYERASSEILGKKRSDDFLGTGVRLSTSMTYSPAESLEVGLSLQWVYRYPYYRLDWGYGIGLSWLP